MALIDATLQAVGNYLASIVPTMSLHSADPGLTGANETSAARQTVSWSVDGDGDLTSGQVAFTGGAASGAVTHVGLWDGATFRGGFALTGDTTFNAAGEYSVTNLTITGTST